MNSFGRSIAGVIAVIMIVIYPLLHIAEGYDSILEGVVKSAVKQCHIRVEANREITLKDYETLIEKLEQTGEYFNIELEAVHPVTGKELYFSVTYSYDILKQLYQTGSFPLQRGDYFIIKVSCKNTSALKKLKARFREDKARLDEIVIGGEII